MGYFASVSIKRALCGCIVTIIATSFAAVAAEVQAACDNCGIRPGSHQPHIDDDVALVQVNIEAKSRHDLRSKPVLVGEAAFRHRNALVTTTTMDPDAVPDTDLAKASKVSLNTAADLGALLASLQLDIEMIIFFMLFFMVMIRYFPNIYAFRATGAGGEEWQRDAPIKWEPVNQAWFQWVTASYSCTVEQMIETCGLDAAFLIRFTVLAMEILAGIFLPNFLILSMMYCNVGPNAAGDDKLSYFGIGNIEVGSWVFWPVAFMTWYNVIFIQYRLFSWQRYFVEYRNRWLLAMPAPRDCTILVEGIEDDYCSDAKLTEYFETMYGKGEILEAFVVKKIPTLEGLIDKYKAADQLMHEAEFYNKEHPGNPKMYAGESEVDYRKREKSELQAQIREEQRLVSIEAAKPPDESRIYATNGFVTFKSRRRTEQAISTRLRADEGSFVMSYAPDPTDVIYRDLEMPVAEQTILQFIGYGLIFGMFLGFMPIVLGISNIASMDNLEKIPTVKKLLEPGGALEDYKATIQGQCASLGLTFMMSMLPTFLMWIFYGFFYLKANRWAQLELQKAYFWFLVIFVLLTTAIGSSVLDTMSEIAQSPFMIFSLLAEKMPLTSHFYMNYVVMQWVTHAMNLTRYITLMKYLLIARFSDPERARALSEPEDQDYYGMGSRSARFTLMLIIGIVFGSISPLVSFFSFINFFLCRGIYGYLIPFAETRKDDLGGDHWAEQMDHVHFGVFIYIVLMVGILCARASSIGPGVVSGMSFLWWIISYNKFSHKLRWEKLAYETVVMGEIDKTVVKRKPTATTYRQMQLDPDVCEKVTELK